ncbi:MAG: exo-alpha-sialidase [Betaproteobacteria bacterium]|nr:exo-alpha-sialidase [Betaproteobacteria bacterium]
MSTDGAETFSFVKGQDGRPAPIAKRITTDARRIGIATTNNGLLLSKDEGKTWKVVTTAYGLPSNSIEQIALSGDKVFAATSNILGISRDFGDTWQNVSLAEKLPSASIGGVHFPLGMIVVSFTRLENVNGSNYINSYSAISTDEGRTFTEVPGGFGGATRWQNEVYFIGKGGIYKISPDLKKVSLVESFPSELTGISSSESGLYASSFGGLFGLGNSIPVTTDASPGVIQKPLSITLTECGETCPNDSPNSSVGNSDTTGTSSGSTTPTVRVSGCEFNFRTSKCDFIVTWTNAPASSCLWVDIPPNSARIFECATPSQPTSGRAVVGWLTPGTASSFFLAREVAPKQFGTKMAAFRIEMRTELVVSRCHAFAESNCTAKIAWKNAPVNSCLWGINPETEQVFLAACATTNPTAHSFNAPWIKYGVRNKFFLAVQSEDPNIPRAERSIEAESAVEARP